MAFSIGTIISSGATSAIITNPISGSVSSISGLTSGLGSLPATIGSIGTAVSNISSLASQATSYMSTEIENLKTKLPIMAAVHTLESAGKVLNGIQPGINPSGALSAATQGITTVGQTMSTLSSNLASSFSGISTALSSTPGVTPQAKLANFAATIPPAELSAGVVNPAYTTFMTNNASIFTALNSVATSLNSLVTSGGSSITSLAASDAAGVAAGSAKLKDLAFAKFSSSPQPPAIQNILNQFVIPPTATSQSELEALSLAKQKVRVQSVENSPSVSSGISSTPSSQSVIPKTSSPAADTQNGNPSSLASYKAANDTAYQILLTWKTSYLTPKLEDAIAWQASNNYKSIKQVAVDNPTDTDKQAAYTDVKNRFIAYCASSEGYTLYKDIFDTAKLAWSNSSDLYLKLVYNEVSTSVNVINKTFGSNIITNVITIPTLST